MEINLEALERLHTDIDSILVELGALGLPAIASGNGLSLLDGLRREMPMRSFFRQKEGLPSVWINSDKIVHQSPTS